MVATRAVEASAVERSAESESVGGMPSTRWRWILSGLILWHLWAVVGEPVEFITRLPFNADGSPAGVALNTPVRRYSEFLYMNHGYAFFAPDPGPSHLIDVHVQRPDGAETSVLYPDLESQWPRLLYHRHFMLTEFLNNVHAAPIPAEVKEREPDEMVRRWQASRDQYESIRDSFRRHLAGKAGVPVDQITVDRVEHRAPFVPEYLRDQVRLRDPRLYVNLLDEAMPPEPYPPAAYQPDPVPRENLPVGSPAAVEGSAVDGPAVDDSAGDDSVGDDLQGEQQ
ncbi:hypothetical protein FF011L_50490 [Roseimaritima multifibrata]|uniref:Uncharacterized protein n=1 Tax=Roseimaritima multifibrata TaxID=1930274 RepID=A0A517MMZ2_9BACT|nr:hypothetical protein [Roseimaritima multifibrata]QDS96241.1 hypothetical protein FF011L_50490 [Roseimaritima multifibrata]